MHAEEPPPWNHNIAYHRLVLATAPVPCGRALDVGCGQGFLLQELAGRCDQVVGLDLDQRVLAATQARLVDRPNVTLRRDDVLTADLPEAGFDLVTAIASLHHLPLRGGMRRLATLVRPGGTLAVVGLYRARTAADYLTSVVAFPVSTVLRWHRGHAAVDAPTHDPTSYLADIRAVARELVPGASIRRRLLFRYTLTWGRQVEPVSQ